MTLLFSSRVARHFLVVFLMLSTVDQKIPLKLNQDTLALPLAGVMLEFCVLLY